MHYYLLGTDKYRMYKNQSIGRRLKFWAQRQFYGFDETDTWGLRFTMIELLYERLRMYRKVAPHQIKLNRPITIRGVTHTELEWVDMLLLMMKQLIMDDFDYDKDGYGIDQLTQQMVWEIWHHIQPSMWW